MSEETTAGPICSNAPTGDWAAAIVAGWEARHDEGWWHTRWPA